MFIQSQVLVGGDHRILLGISCELKPLSSYIVGPATQCHVKLWPASSPARLLEPSLLGPLISAPGYGTTPAISGRSQSTSYRAATRTVKERKWWRGLDSNQPTFVVVTDRNHGFVRDLDRVLQVTPPRRSTAELLPEKERKRYRWP